MGINNKNHSHENKMNDGYYDFQGGFVSYNPSTLTEHYTVRGFEGNAKKKQISESHWS